MTKSMTPAEFDAAEIELIGERDRINALADRIVQEAHGAAGDTRSFNGWGRNRVVSWQLSDDEALERSGRTGQHAAFREGAAALGRQVAAMEDVYRASPWTRWYPCLNADGHIHCDDRACPTLHRNGSETDMGWETRLSGQPVAVVIETLGPRLCSVCFPDAPAEHCRSLSDITRADREAARAARNAARDAKSAVKNLADYESFRDHDGDRVTTVAAAKDAVRKPAGTAVELEWYRSDAAARGFGDPETLRNVILNVTERLAGEKADMERAYGILLAREAAVPGTGWTRKDADKAVASAARRARKAYFG
jgi:hypothetical protein